MPCLTRRTKHDAVLLLPRGGGGEVRRRHLDGADARALSWSSSAAADVGAFSSSSSSFSPLPPPPAADVAEVPSSFAVAEEAVAARLRALLSRFWRLRRSLRRSSSEGTNVPSAAARIRARSSWRARTAATAPRGTRMRMVSGAARDEEEEERVRPCSSPSAAAAAAAAFGVMWHTTVPRACPAFLFCGWCAASVCSLYSFMSAVDRSSSGAADRRTRRPRARRCTPTACGSPG